MYIILSLQLVLFSVDYVVSQKESTNYFLPMFFWDYRCGVDTMCSNFTIALLHCGSYILPRCKLYLVKVTGGCGYELWLWVRDTDSTVT